MTHFEYKAVPAPITGTKAKGVKTTEDRFALSMTDALNDMAEEGWEYVRAETLPCEERKGLTGRETTYQNLLIFRRALAGEEDVPAMPATVPDEELPEARLEAEPPRPRLTSRPPESGHAPSISARRD